MRILVIEDEHKIAASIKRGLEQEGYIVDAVYSGTEGYDFASTEEYDLIILDRLLPGIDGLAICEKLRLHNIHVPIIMLTAKSALTDTVEGLNAGADDYMTKPFAFIELLARVRALARRPTTAIGSVLKIGDLTLDSTNFEVKRKGKLIKLSHTEFSLLQYLMRHQNKIVTKSQIINHVWNYDANVLPNSVEVYIKHLRDKIDKPFKRPTLIHTLRGFGYKIGGKE